MHAMARAMHPYLSDGSALVLYGFLHAFIAEIVERYIAACALYIRFAKFTVFGKTDACGAEIAGRSALFSNDAVI